MAYKKLMKDLNYIALTYENDEFDKKRILHFCGRLSFANEFKLITQSEFINISTKLMTLISRTL